MNRRDLRTLARVDEALWRIHEEHTAIIDPERRCACCQCVVCEAWHAVRRAHCEVERPGHYGPHASMVPEDRL